MPRLGHDVGHIGSCGEQQRDERAPQRVGRDGPDLLTANLRKLFVGQLDRCCEKAIANVGRVLPLAPAGGEDGELAPR